MSTKRTIFSAAFAIAILGLAGSTTAGEGNQYMVRPLTTGPENHKWPSLNDTGDAVWSQTVDGHWQVFRNGNQVTTAARNHERPTISNSGEMMYFVDTTGGGVGYQVLRRSPSGGESIVEMSTRNNATGDQRVAGKYFGMASNGTSISTYTFFRNGSNTRRLNVSGLGELGDGFGGRGDFSLYDYPDINANGIIVYANDFRAGTSHVYRASTAFPFTQTPIGLGELPRVADGQDPEIVFVREGTIVSTKGQEVGPGTWADVNSAGRIVLERQVDGANQVFEARRCTIDLAKEYRQFFVNWMNEPLGQTTTGATLGAAGCVLTTLSMALYHVGVTQLPLDGAWYPNDPKILNILLRHANGPFNGALLFLENGVRAVDQVLNPGGRKLNFEDRRGPPGFDSAVSIDNTNEELNRILCELRLPVMVRVRKPGASEYGHSVLVTGRRELASGEVKYDLADPGTASPRTLDFYPDFFVVGYVEDPPGNFSRLTVSSNDAVEFEVTDPAGRGTGYGSVGSGPIGDVPRSVYDTEIITDDSDPPVAPPLVGRTFTARQPEPGQYRLVLRGTKAGAYSVIINVWTPEGDSQPVVELTGSTAAGAVASYSILVNTAAGEEPRVVVNQPPANRPPTADAGPDQRVECGTATGTQVQLEGSGSSDPDGDALTHTWTGSFAGGVGTVTGPRPTVTLPLGQHDIHLDVADGRGELATDTTSVQVVDTTAPTWTGRPQQAITVEQSSLAGTAVDLPRPAASDACDASPVVTSNAPAVFPLGRTLVTFQAVDASGNVATATTEVTVVDTRAPSITSIAATPDRLWPASGQMVSVTISVSVTDACDAAPTCRIASVTSHDPSEPCREPRTGPDWIVTGALNLDLRAGRPGMGTARTYDVTVSCLDASGNAAERRVTVVALNDRGAP